MSITFIVVLLAVVSALVGIKVYLEYKEEKKIEEAKETDAFEDPHPLIINPVQINHLFAEKKEEEKAVENPIDSKIPDPEPVVALPKNKKKKRYYGKQVKKQPKKSFNNNKKSE